MESSPAEQLAPLILVVDDDRSMRTLLTLALQQDGYRVAQSSTGEQGLSDFQRLQPDMLLMDAMMPGMNGFECCQRIQSLNQSNPIPLLMITVLDDQASVDRAFAAGAQDYITKPIHWAVLSQRVKLLLNGYRALQQSDRIQQQLFQYQHWETLHRQLMQQLLQGQAWSELARLGMEGLLSRFPGAEGVIYDRKKNLVLQALLKPDSSQDSLQPLVEFLSTQASDPTIWFAPDYPLDLPEGLMQWLQKQQISSFLAMEIATQPLLPAGICLFWRTSALPSWNISDLDRIEDIARLLTIAARLEDPLEDPN